VNRGYKVATISRHATDQVNHFQCDISDFPKLRETLTKIQIGFYHLDVVVCVVGFGRSNQDFQNIDWMNHMVQNFMYVDVVFRQIAMSLRYTAKPIGITIGSRYSHSGIDFSFMLPYVCAKYALRGLTQDIAMRYPRASVNNYCVVPMDTPTRAEVYANMKEGDIARDLLADPKIVAHGMLEHALRGEYTGQTFIVNHDGLVFPIEDISLSKTD